MTAAIVFVSIVAWIHSAMRLSAWVRVGYSRESNAGVLPIVMWMLLFFSVFQGALQVLGYVEIATGRAVVTVTNLLFIALGGSVIAELLWRRAGVAHAAAPPLAGTPQVVQGCWRALREYGWLTGIAVAVFVVLALLNGLQYPRGFEVAAYHLPVGIHVFQEHSFRPWDSTPFHVTTANASLFFAYLMQALPEQPVSSASLFFAVALCASLFGIALHIGAGKRASALAVVGLCAIPIVGFSMFLLSGDIGGVAFLATALYFLLVRPVGASLSLLFCGMAAGLAYGFKMYHAPSVAYLLLLVACGVGHTHDSSGPRLGLQGRTVAAIVFLAGALLTSGFWFARSYHWFANPLFPLELPLVGKLFGWLASEEGVRDPAANAAVWVRSAAEWFAYPWVEWHKQSFGFTMSAGLGPFFAAAFPATMLAVGGALLVGRKQRGCEIAALWAGVPLVLIAWWFTGQQPRYAIGALVYMTPLVAWTISRCDTRAERIAYRTLAACAVIGLLIIFTKEVIGFGDRMVLARQFARADFYEYPRELDRLPAGSRIATIGSRAEHFRVLGAKHEFRVISYPEVMRRLNLPGEVPGSKMLWPYSVPAIVELPAEPLRDLRVSHIYVSENTELRPDPCVTLTEVGGLYRNPYNQQPLPAPRRLLAVTLCKKS